MSKVEEYNLVDITSGIHTGLNPRKNFKLNTLDAKFYYVTVKEIASNKVIFSENTDRINSDAWNVIQNRSHLSKGDILFSGIGTIGKVAYVNEDPKNWNCSESVYVIKPFNGLSGKYLYYVLQTNKIIKQYEANSAGSIMKGVRKANLEQLRIPLPHIKIQEEIVKILDSFTNLIDALNEELSLRQKQFEYYREKLLTFKTNVKNIVFDILENIAPYSKKRINSEMLNAENYVGVDNLLQNKEGKDISTSVPNSGNWTRYDEGDILIGNIRPYLKKIWIADKTGGASGDVLVFSLKDKSLLLPKYLYYLLSSDKFFEYDNNSARGAGMPRGDKKVICRYLIAFPKDKTIQQSIVEKLDAFESLISSLKEEIALRQKQYEYYREKLLTFD